MRGHQELQKTLFARACHTSTLFARAWHISTLFARAWHTSSKSKEGQNKSDRASYRDSTRFFNSVSSPLRPGDKTFVYLIISAMPQQALTFGRGKIAKYPIDAKAIFHILSLLYQSKPYLDFAASLAVAAFLEASEAAASLAARPSSQRIRWELRKWKCFYSLWKCKCFYSLWKWKCFYSSWKWKQSICKFF